MISTTNSETLNIKKFKIIQIKKIKKITIPSKGNAKCALKHPPPQK